jgi:hypothetical protein
MTCLCSRLTARSLSSMRNCEKTKELWGNPNKHLTFFKKHWYHKLNKHLSTLPQSMQELEILLEMKSDEVDPKLRKTALKVCSKILNGGCGVDRSVRRAWTIVQKIETYVCR